MNLSWINEYGSYFVQGTIETLTLLLLSWAWGFVLAILIGFGRISQSRLIRAFCGSFSSIIRGTPLLLQIFFFYYGLGGLLAGSPFIRHSVAWPYIRSLDAFWYVVFALTLSVAAYGGEVIRGALLSVPRGEIEAARAFGFDKITLIRRIWLPRALQTSMPTITGETVLLLKSTALASSVTVIDLLGAARVVSAQTFRTYEPLVFVAAGYFLITLVIEHAFSKIEARLNPQRSPEKLLATSLGGKQIYE